MKYAKTLTARLTSTPRYTRPELEAIEQAHKAHGAIQRAIDAYVLAGFGSCVTDPLRDALAQVAHSLREVQS